MKLELLFPIHLRAYLKELNQRNDLEEIRIRIGQPLFFYTGEKELVLVKQEKTGYLKESCDKDAYNKAYLVTESDLLEMQNYMSNYSLYAWQEEIKQGFLTIQGGHRIGLAGGTSNENGKINSISYLTFLNIRVAHERKGCANEILNYIVCKEESGRKSIYNTLLVSPPGGGKTTLLRDLIRSLSYEGIKIGVVDERSEIASCYHGIPQNDIGPRTDVLDGCPKTAGMQMLLRTMSPHMIAVDELGDEKDVTAVEQAAYSGCKVVGTIHAGSIKELYEKPLLKRWSERELFQRYVFIDKGVDGMRKCMVYNQWWELVC